MIVEKNLKIDDNSRIILKLEKRVQSKNVQVVAKVL